MVSWSEVAVAAGRGLSDAGIELAATEARWITQEVSGILPSEWHTESKHPATARCVAAVDEMVLRRRAGEPIQYVLGRWGFRTLDLAIDPRVLIPRPETESLVGIALRELQRCTTHHPLVVDLGTGSGAVALAIAVECARAQVFATDVDSSALAVARANLAGVGGAATRVRLSEGSWFEALPRELRGRCDVVVTNPPYIASDEQLPCSVRDWEPVSALIAGPNGTECVELVLREAFRWLSVDGIVVVEMAASQTETAIEVAAQVGYGVSWVESDLAGTPRFVVASASSRE